MANWITSPPLIDQQNLKENEDFVSIAPNYSLALVSATIQDNDHVVTGARFRKTNGHIGIEVRATRYDLERGILMDPEASFWIGNSNSLNQLELHEPDVPTKSPTKSQMYPESNEFIKLRQSDPNKGCEQTTVPYLDTTTIASYVPLSGVGLYYKSTAGYGGFVAPKLLTYDFGPLFKIKMPDGTILKL